MVIEAKPCPFCGSTNLEIEEFKIGDCTDDCGTEGQVTCGDCCTAGPLVELEQTFISNGHIMAWDGLFFKTDTEAYINNEHEQIMNKET